MTFKYYRTAPVWNNSFEFSKHCFKAKMGEFFFNRPRTIHSDSYSYKFSLTPFSGSESIWKQIKPKSIFFPYRFTKRRWRGIHGRSNQGRHHLLRLLPRSNPQFRRQDQIFPVRERPVGLLRTHDQRTEKCYRLHQNQLGQRWSLVRGSQAGQEDWL